MAAPWSLEIGRSLDGLGMNALVVEATTATGAAVVLKIAPPDEAEKLPFEASCASPTARAAPVCTTPTSVAGPSCSSGQAPKLAKGVWPPAPKKWGTAERVLSGLWCRLMEFPPHGDRQLADAERFCAASRRTDFDRFALNPGPGPTDGVQEEAWGTEGMGGCSLE